MQMIKKITLLIKSLAKQMGYGWHLKESKIGTRQTSRVRMSQRPGSTTENSLYLVTACLISEGRGLESGAHWWPGYGK